jgi:aspartate aminotransferase
MEEGDEVLYPSPGYPIYESMIKYLGGVPVPYIFKETTSGFEMDLEYVQAKINPKTKVFIYNNYSNPMGVMSSDEEMKSKTRSGFMNTKPANQLLIIIIRNC